MKRLEVIGLEGVPEIQIGDDLTSHLIEALKLNDVEPKDYDVICIASKPLAITEGCIVSLDSIIVSPIAKDISLKIPRKDPRAIQVILEQTGDCTGRRIELGDNYIAGWLKNGNRLTSAGVDKYSSSSVVVLPENIDVLACKIGESLYQEFGKMIAIVVSDSDGRVEKKGATQISVGSFGLFPLRITKSVNPTTNKESEQEETIVDMLAAAAGLVMGQRGNKIPFVVIRGLEYTYEPSASFSDCLMKGTIN